jgi:hypothetical protein
MTIKKGESELIYSSGMHKFSGSVLCEFAFLVLYVRG